MFSDCIGKLRWTGHRRNTFEKELPPKTELEKSGQKGSEKVVRVTQGITKTEEKLPEVKNTRERAEGNTRDRAESQAVQMWREAEESLSPTFPTGSTRDALGRGAREGHHRQHLHFKTAEVASKWTQLHTRWTLVEPDSRWQRFAFHFANGGV